MNKKLVTTPVEYLYSMMLLGFLINGVLLATNIMQFSHNPDKSQTAGFLFILVGFGMGVFRTIAVYIKTKKAVSK